MKKLIVADSTIPFAESMYKDIANLRLVDSNSINPKNIHDADILIVRSVTKVGKELLADSKIKFVCTVTSGFDHVDQKYLSSKGIKFSYAPGCNSNSVAEYIVAALLFLRRKYDFDFKKTTLGVVGIGNVGSKVVRKASALGLKILQNDPPLKRTTGSKIFLPLDELMKADIITLHVPLTFEGEDTTYHLFDEKRINAMKPGSILINTSRGPVVETNALKKALGSGYLRTAILDVWENEPDIDADLFSMSAIGTPHIAGYSLDGKLNGAFMIYGAVCNYLNIVPHWNPDRKLSPPQFSEIILDEQEMNNEKVIDSIVRKCYDIEKDDAEFRKALNMVSEDRKRYFSKLREEYPVRREFAATKIVVPKFELQLAKLISDIGFSIVYM